MHGQRNIKKEKKRSCFLRRFLCLNFVVLKKNGTDFMLEILMGEIHTTYVNGILHRGLKLLQELVD